MTFLRYEESIQTEHLSSPFSLAILFAFQYAFCFIIYIAWKYNFIRIKFSTILSAKLMKAIFYIESIRVTLLAFALLSNDDHLSNNIFLITIIKAGLKTNSKVKN